MVSFKDLYLNPMERFSVTTVITKKTLNTGLFRSELHYKSWFEEDRRKVNFSEYIPVITGVKRVLTHVVSAVIGVDYEVSEIKRGFLEIIPLIGNVIMNRFDQGRLCSIEDKVVHENDVRYFSEDAFLKATFKDGELEVEEYIVQKCEPNVLQATQEVSKEEEFCFFQENNVADSYLFID
ncbi:MAG: hypothetical protein K2X08_06440 [Chlamydiales bacterium]|nr:hypothetical protein [Chlamydiales bacterium]